MIRRAVTVVSLAFAVAAATSVPHVAHASSRHGALGTHDGTISIGIGRGIGTSAHALAPGHPLLTVPVPSAIQERRSAPAVKATHEPFPDFDVPLRRHRMAMPNSAIPALGDLSF